MIHVKFKMEVVKYRIHYESIDRMLSVPVHAHQKAPNVDSISPMGTDVTWETYTP